MKKSPRKYVYFSVLFCSLTSAAPTPTYQWQGFYLGATTGATFSDFQAKTMTTEGPLFPGPIETGLINRAGNQTIDTKGFLAGVEGGYNWRRNNLLFGLEADLQSLSTNGDTHTNAISYEVNRQFVITSYASNNWLFTARPRIGLVNDNWLFYITGGLGLAYVRSDFLFTTNVSNFESQKIRTIDPGYVVGAGVETGLTNHISIKAEYLYAKFNSMKAYSTNHFMPTGQMFTNRLYYNSNIWKLGLNYQFDDQSVAGSVNILQLPELLNPTLWQTEIGTRLFVSTGVAGAPQPLLNSAPDVPLASRLIYSNLFAISEEVYARADHDSGFLVKGNIGAGSITHGQLNDEDFPAGGAYSNTLSQASGNLSYATVDFGYSFLQTPSAKVAALVGYNYYAQNINVYGCGQTAGAEVCVPSHVLNNFVGISEDDRYNSFRIGLTSQFNVANNLTLTSEAAYLPYVYMRGTDLHNARQLVGPESSEYGDGAMLEAVLNYQIAKSWDVGLGWRYWMWNMHNGDVGFKLLGEPGSLIEPGRYNAERYGAFVQVSYRDRKSDNTYVSSSQQNWQGLYVGGELGGAWGRSNWSDPFGPTIDTVSGLTNKTGFGDKIRANGPIGGIVVNLNLQQENLVYGVGADFSLADIRGENTLYSGLGGMNGQTINNYLLRLVGRVGTAYDHSLFYLNAGRALLSSKCTVNGNTNALIAGSESQTFKNWGWTMGAGVDYALTDRWVSSVEYDYVYIPSHNVAFPRVLVVNEENLKSNNRLNIFKLGVSYKFDV